MLLASETSMTSGPSSPDYYYPTNLKLEKEENARLKTLLSQALHTIQDLVRHQGHLEHKIDAYMLANTEAEGEKRKRRSKRTNTTTTNNHDNAKRPRPSSSSPHPPHPPPPPLSGLPLLAAVATCDTAVLSFADVILGAAKR